MSEPKKNEDRHATQKDAQRDEEHIVRSENSKNPNVELYGKGTSDADNGRGRREQAKNDDPERYPGQGDHNR